MARIGGRSRARRQLLAEEERLLRRSRGRSCLMYILIALGILLILSLMFGGFHKGKFHGGSLGRPGASGAGTAAAAAVLTR